MRRFFSASILTSLSIAVDPRLDLGLRLAEHLQPEADIVADRHMRKQRVVLEDGIDRPLERRQRRDVLAIEQDFALGRIVEAGDQPQQRGLAAAGRPKQREELVFADGDGDIVESGDLALACAKDLADAANVDRIPIRSFRHSNAPLFTAALVAGLGSLA